MPHDRPNPLRKLILFERAEKPRQRGLTMIADWGLDPTTQENKLETMGPYVDLAKIAVGISALLSSDSLTRKLDRYRACDITPFPGGQFLEHAVLHGRSEEYLDGVAEAGFDCIEVSDNLLEIPLDEKWKLIRTARSTYGLRVLGEVGKKEGLAATADLAEDAAGCLEAGAERVFLEAADFFGQEIRETELQSIVDRCGTDPLLFELPGPWIKGITLSDVHQVTLWLIDRFGADAGIGNVAPDDVLKLEALRLAIGVNAGSMPQDRGDR